AEPAAADLLTSVVTTLATRWMQVTRTGQFTRPNTQGRRRRVMACGLLHRLADRVRRAMDRARAWPVADAGAAVDRGGVRVVLPRALRDRAELGALRLR